MNRLALHFKNSIFLVNNTRFVINKNNVIHECRRHNHVFTFKNQLSKHCRNFKINNVTFKRLASTALYDSNKFMSEPLNHDGGQSEFVAEVYSKIVEPSFEELGLGGDTTWGLLQSGLEYLHVDCGLPWWGAVPVALISMRILFFPLAVMARKNALILYANASKLEHLSKKAQMANLQGYVYESRLYNMELQQFKKDKNIKIFRNFIPPIIQGGIFYSFFRALNGMVNANIDSLHTGGILWFKDLTLTDPYFILPLYTGVSLFLILKYGIEAFKIQEAYHPFVKAVFYMIPCTAAVVACNMNCLTLLFWVSNSGFSFLQIWIMKSEIFGKFLGTRDIKYTKDNAPL